jgi:predicted lipoprotein with Yx(FWY)xxD motif
MFKVRSFILLVLVLLVATPVLAQAPAPLVSVSSSKELGKFLVGKDGMTLYSYTPDPLNESACYDNCAKAWPPLTVDSADKLTVADGIPGTFGTTTRKDGTLQVTYNGIPLYYWVKDTKAGDTTGHRVGRVWWVVPPATVYSQRIPKLGSVLVGANGMTLYLYTKDTADMSTCYDQCAVNWPPLTVKSADDFVPGINLPGKFNTITRTDGTLQVTYNGMPLYYWKNDKALGDATGEGVGKVWYTVVPETVAASNSKDLGDFLVSADGMTLYAYAKDTAGASTCSGDCAKNWPPLTVGADDRLAAGTGITGKLATIKRDDNSLQVTYNGIPLYFYAQDHVPGDATGQNVGNVWAVVKP